MKRKKDSLCTCVFIKNKLDIIATIKVLDVIKSPSGNIVSLEWHIYWLPWRSSHGKAYQTEETQKHKWRRKRSHGGGGSDWQCEESVEVQGGFK